MPKLKASGLISLDSETTGVDPHHGSMPFVVTICKEDGTQLCWEWDVDPVTRRPHVPPEDTAEVRAELAAAGEIVLHNAKFDAKALEAGAIVPEWSWVGVHDTLLAAHLLASNRPKDLTALALEYLGVDIQTFEDRMEQEVVKAR